MSTQRKETMRQKKKVKTDENFPEVEEIVSSESAFSDSDDPNHKSNFK